MASLILVGPLWSSDSQGSDLVKEAKAQGHVVTLVVPASEEELADVHALVDHLIRVDADMEDEAAAVQARILVDALEIAPIAIFPANEFGVVLAARLGTALGLAANPVEVALTLRDKSRQRHILEAAGFPTPAYRRFTERKELEQVAREMQFPVVVKPVDGAGKVGVFKAYDAASLLAAFDSAAVEAGSKFSYRKIGSAWIVEEFIEGNKFTLELVVSAPHDITPMVLTETTVVGDNFIEIGHALPSALPAEVRRAIDDYGVRVLEAIGVQHGVVHLELQRRHNDGEIFVIELNGRIPGGRMAKLLEEASGNNYYRIVLDVLQTGRRPTLKPFSRCVAVHWFCRGTGKLEAIDGFESLDSAPGFIEKFMRLQVGDVTKASSDGFDRIGYSMNAADDLETAKAIARDAAVSVKLRYA